MKAIHIVRYNGRGHLHKSKRKSKPAREYAQGHFTALILRHNWPPNFRPTVDKELAKSARSLASSISAANAREVAAATMTGWGLGSLYGISDAANKRVATVPKPGWMGDAK